VVAHGKPKKHQKSPESANSLIASVSSVIKAFFGNDPVAAGPTGSAPQQPTTRPIKTDKDVKLPAKSPQSPDDIKPHFHRKYVVKKRGLGDMAVPLDRVRSIAEKPRMLPNIRRVHPGPTMS